MRIILVQGMAGVGKSSLCKQLERDLPSCRWYSLDAYKEDMWDKFGFDSVKQREHQSDLARQLYYSDINDAIRDTTYDYILLDYAFTDKYWNELIESVNNITVLAKTLYLMPASIPNHRAAWEARSRNFSARHAGHGATHYHDGVGSDYVNNYDSKVVTEMSTLGDTMEVIIDFQPYRMNRQYMEIMHFIMAGGES